MKAVLQRVSQARVEVEGQVVGRVARGWLVLLGVADGDTPDDAAYLADRVAGVRAFADAAGKMNLAVADAGGGILLVSQFTLLANLSKGRRPSFELAMAPEPARALCDHVMGLLRQRGLGVEGGIFGADMQVHLVNDGPVTLLMDSRERGAASAHRATGSRRLVGAGDPAP